MSFLHPLILGVGLGAVAIPVVIHFLRRRRRPIPWAAMRFLQEAMRKRRRRLKLEQLLLLLTRVVVVALLALAVARPVLGARPGSARPTVLVLALDDSIGSGLAAGPGRTDLEAAVAEAKRALDGLNTGSGDRAGLVTLGAPGRLEVWPPTADLDAVRRALDRLTPTDSGPTAAALREALAGMAPGPDAPAPERTVVRLISAWRGTDPETLFGGTSLTGVAAVSVSAPGVEGVENLGVRSMEVSTPTVLGSAGSLAPATQVSLGLERSGTTDERLVEVELIALPGGSIAGRTQARFGPGEARARAVASADEAALAHPGRGQRVVLEARLPADANPLDNRARAVLTVRPELRVAVVERPAMAGSAGVAAGVWVLAALAPDERAGIEAFRVDPASLGSVPAASMDAVFILEPGRMTGDGWSRAREVLGRGGLVAITPDADGTPVNWGDELAGLTQDSIRATPGGVGDEAATRLSPRDLPGGVLAGLSGELPELAGAVGVRRMVRLDLQGGAEALLRTEDGGVFAVGASASGGLVVVFAAAMDIGWTDLPARPAFVPVVQELVRRGAGTGADAAAVAGAPLPESLGLDRWEFDAGLSGGSPGEGVLGARAGVLAGLGVDGAVLRMLAVNPDAPAARTDPANAEALNAAVAQAFPGASLAEITAGDAAATRRAGPAGDRLALALLAAVAALMLMEALLARAASHPNAASAGGAA